MKKEKTSLFLNRESKLRKTMNNIRNWKNKCFSNSIKRSWTKKNNGNIKREKKTFLFPNKEAKQRKTKIT